MGAVPGFFGETPLALRTVLSIIRSLFLRGRGGIEAQGGTWVPLS